MKPIVQTLSFKKRLAPIRWVTGAFLSLLMLFQSSAHASMFKGEALDNIADVMSWIVLIIAPIAAITVFLLIHILPEKIAEKKQHPQADAIKTLCLLSLFFGGMLWPLAWLWAYSKPVMYKLAYGTDKVGHGHDAAAVSAAGPTDVKELDRLRKQVNELETRLAEKSGSEGEKA